MKSCFVLRPVPVLVFFFWGITLSFSTASAFVIPDTEVTKCYDDQGNQIVCPKPGEPFYGQDANYGPGTMALTNNGNGTATDDNTGLMWEVKGAADGDTDFLNPNDADNTYSWSNAQDAVDDLNAKEYAGHSDWRLPTMKELDTLLDLSKDVGPNLDTNIFPNCKSGKYWTSTPYAADLSNYWFIDFSTGGDGYLVNSNGFYMRAVR